MNVPEAQVPSANRLSSALDLEAAEPDGMPDDVTTGAILFARFAYPPNELGYCGPPDHRALLEYGANRAVDPGLAQLARGFAGAWPYLELIARTTRIGDPLDRRVVEAYWLGSGLLESVDVQDFGNSIRDRFRRRAGMSWSYLEENVPEGALPNHSFHVFGVYPWVGLLGSDRGDTPLTVLDRCRIRWGQVVATRGEEVDVLSRPLTYDGRLIGLGEPRVETARGATSGLAFIDAYKPGDWVALHWGWVCDRLTRRQLANVRRYTLRQLRITNERLAHSGPAIAMG